LDAWKNVTSTRTAASRRAQRKAEYDTFLAACPTRQLLDAISSKWVSLNLAALAEGPQRYDQLAARIGGVSPKMLTQTLRNLEHDGLLVRTVTAQVPVRVDYDPTPLGRSPLSVVDAIRAWAEARIDDVLTARTTASAVH